MKPCRPYNRFKPTAKIHSGVDPNGAFLSFINKDTKKVYRAESYRKKYADDLAEMRKTAPNGLVPVGTTKHTYKLGLSTIDHSAKLDREQLGMTTLNYPRNPTDLMSFDAPNRDKPF